EDVNEESEFLVSIIAFLSGLLGFLPLSVGTGLIDFLLTTSIFIFVWVAFGFLFALLINFRFRITRRLIVGRDFKEVVSRYKTYRISLIVLFFSSGIIGLAIFYLPLKQLSSLSFVL